MGVKMKAALRMVCEHEPECSKPSSYCRIGQFTELVNQSGDLTEIVMPDDVPEGCSYFCTECNAEAHLVREEKSKKKVDQTIMDFERCQQQGIL